jgi:hypothetical protein
MQLIVLANLTIQPKLGLFNPSKEQCDESGPSR